MLQRYFITDINYPLYLDSAHIFSAILNKLNQSDCMFFIWYVILPVTKTEQEIGFVSPSYECNVVYTLTQRYLWK